MTSKISEVSTLNVHRFFSELDNGIAEHGQAIVRSKGAGEVMDINKWVNRLRKSNPKVAQRFIINIHNIMDIKNVLAGYALTEIVKELQDQPDEWWDIFVSDILGIVNRYY